MKIYLKLLFAMLVWGGTFTSARILGNQLDPSVSAFLRFLIASTVLLVMLYYKEGGFPRISRKQLLPILGMGLTGIAMYNLLFFYGLVHAEASRGSMITATNPLLTALGAAFIFKERFTLIRVVGFILCVVGAVLIISRGDIKTLFTDGVGTGELAFIGCAISWAAYTLIGRLMSTQLSSLAVIAYASTVGTAILFFVALNANLFEAVSMLTLNASMNLFYLAILATVIGFVWFQEGIKILGAAKAAVFIYFMPVSAVFWAYLILDEKLTLVLMLGAALVISGIYLVNKKAE
ncbi:MAG: DMT family transporter [Cocleimonas sp.]